MLHAVDFVLVGAIAVGLPARALWSYRRLAAATDDALGTLRPRLYGRAILSQWALVAAVIAWWVVRGRAWGDLALVPTLSWPLAGVAVGLAFVVVAMARLHAQVASDPEARENVRRQVANVRRLLPATDGEQRLFYVLAVTAGVCEELLFRGYLVWVLGHAMPLVAAHAVSAVLFGVGHLYQGPRGIVRTGLAGAFFSGLVLLTGMLWPAIVVHAAMDVNAGLLGRRVNAGDPPAAAPAVPDELETS